MVKCWMDGGLCTFVCDRHFNETVRTPLPSPGHNHNNDPFVYFSSIATDRCCGLVVALPPVRIQRTTPTDDASCWLWWCWGSIVLWGRYYRLVGGIDAVIGGGRTLESHWIKSLLLLRASCEWWRLRCALWVKVPQRLLRTVILFVLNCTRSGGAG